MSDYYFELVKEECKRLIDKGWSIKDVIACIHDLFQEYLIDESQEIILYRIVDPDDKYNNCFDYWYHMDFKNPLFRCLSSTIQKSREV